MLPTGNVTLSGGRAVEGDEARALVEGDELAVDGRKGTSLANTGVLPRDVMPVTLTPVPAAPRLKATFAPGCSDVEAGHAAPHAEGAQAARLVDHGDPAPALVIARGRARASVDPATRVAGTRRPPGSPEVGEAGVTEVT